MIMKRSIPGNLPLIKFVSLSRIGQRETAMAELIQVRMEDFRAFRKASLNLASSGLNLVTGPNNSGKSSLLSAFDVIAGTDMATAVRHSLGSRARVWARFQLNEQERAGLLQSPPDPAQLLSRGAAEWVEWEFADNENSMPAVAVRLSWLDSREVAIATCEVSGHSWNMSMVSAPLADGNFELTHNSGGSGSGGGLPDPLAELNNVHVLQPIRTVLPEWRQGFFHFKPLRQSAGRESATSGIVPALQSDGSNLPAVLLHMFTNSLQAWAELKQLLEKIVPGVGNLMTPINGNSFQVLFGHEYDYTDSYSEVYRIEDYRHNLKDLGTGVEQILMTLVVGLTQTAKTVVIEEPETGLHPAAQRALLSLLQEWSKGRLFFATTHSSAMLDWSSPDDTTVYSIYRTSTESSVAPVEVSDERAEVLLELGVRLSDVLSAERILIHEGPTDGNILAVWFPSIVHDPRIVMIQGGGGPNARHADLLASWIETADGLGTRRLLYIRDRDEIGGATLQRLEASPNVHVLSCREIENFLLNFDAIAKVINAARGKSGLEPVTPEALTLKAKMLADGLKQTVVLKQVIQEKLGALYFLDNETRENLVRQKAGAPDLIAAIVLRIPQENKLRGEIEVSWATNEHEVESLWEEQWRTLVPGADLLKVIWSEYLGQGYSKKVDGALIARQMSPPEELVHAVGNFIGDE